jgi:hypothetical protein
VGFVLDLDRFFNNFLYAQQHFIPLLLAKISVLLGGCAEEHELAHKFDLLLSDLVYFLFVAVFPLKLAQSLGHNDLVFLSHTANHNFFHAIHHHLG